MIKRFVIRSWCTISNVISFTRLLITPLVVHQIMHAEWMGALCWFMLAAATDFFDGFFARAFDQQTWIGSILDPIADKTLILVTLATLYYYPGYGIVIPPIFMYLMVAKESMLCLGTILMAIVEGGIELRPIFLSKVSSFLQMTTIVWYLMCFIQGIQPLLLTGCLLTGVSGISIAVVILYIYYSGWYVLRFFYRMMKQLFIGNIS